MLKDRSAYKNTSVGAFVGDIFFGFGERHPLISWPPGMLKFNIENTTFLDFWPKIAIPLNTMWYCKVLEANIQTESHPIDFPGPVQEAHHASNLPQIQTFRSGSYKIITFGNYSVSMNLARQIWAAIKWISCENQHWITLGEGLPSWQRIQYPIRSPALLSHMFFSLFPSR